MKSHLFPESTSLHFMYPPSSHPSICHLCCLSVKGYEEVEANPSRVRWLGVHPWHVVYLSQGHFPVSFRIFFFVRSCVNHTRSVQYSYQVLVNNKEKWPCTKSLAWCSKVQHVWKKTHKVYIGSKSKQILSVYKPWIFTMPCHFYCFLVHYWQHSHSEQIQSLPKTRVVFHFEDKKVLQIRYNSCTGKCDRLSQINYSLFSLHYLWPSYWNTFE